MGHTVWSDFSCILALLALMPLTCFSQAAPFNLPSQSLAGSLKALGAQTNINVVVLSVDTFWELKNRNKPVEMWIYRDEGHQKSLPAHVFSVYERSVDRFRFWLQDYEDPHSKKVEQYARWGKLRGLQASSRVRK